MLLLASVNANVHSKFQRRNASGLIRYSTFSFDLRNRRLYCLHGVNAGLSEIGTRFLPAPMARARGSSVDRTIGRPARATPISWRKRLASGALRGTRHPSSLGKRSSPLPWLPRSISEGTEQHPRSISPSDSCQPHAVPVQRPCSSSACWQLLTQSVRLNGEPGESFRRLFEFRAARFDIVPERVPQPETVARRNWRS